MLKIILAVAILAGAVFVGPRLADSQGFVHIATNEYIVETSLTTAIVIAVFAFFILHFVVNLVTDSVKLPGSISRWFSNHKARRGVNLQGEAFLAYEEGAYARSLALIRKSGNRDSLPAHCLLLGAKAAFKLADYGACRNFLDAAEQAPQNSDLACKLLRAKLNLKLNNAKAALENLDSIDQNSYSQNIVNKLYIECYEQEHNYAKINELLPQLKKQKILSAAEFDSLSAKCHAALSKDFNDASQVHELINGLSRSQKNDPSFMAPILTRLVELGDVPSASSQAVNLLRHSNEPALLSEIAKWPQASDEVLLELNKQLSTNAGSSALNVPLLAAVANLELQANELEKAKGHIDQALEVDQTKDIYLLAAKINEKQGQFDKASEYFALALR